MKKTGCIGIRKLVDDIMKLNGLPQKSIKVFGDYAIVTSLNLQSMIFPYGYYMTSKGVTNKHNTSGMYECFPVIQEQ